MKYNLSNEFHKRQFLTRVSALCDKGVIVELTEKKGVRSNNQNAYLHLILGLFALEVGETLEYVKKYYYKIHCNKELFVISKSDKFLGNVRDIRSSASLDTEEMTLSIERFRNWASEQGIYLPEPNEEEMLRQIEVELSRNKAYL